MVDFPIYSDLEENPGRPKKLQSPPNNPKSNRGKLFATLTPESRRRGSLEPCRSGDSTAWPPGPAPTRAEQCFPRGPGGGKGTLRAASAPWVPLGTRSEVSQGL